MKFSIRCMKQQLLKRHSNLFKDSNTKSEDTVTKVITFAPTYGEVMPLDASASDCVSHIFK